MEALFLHPELDKMLQDIKNAERLRECLQLRISLSKKDLSSKSQFEKNEVEILELETLMKISSVTKIISERRNLFNEAFMEHIGNLFNAENNSDSMLNDHPEFQTNTDVIDKETFDHPEFYNELVRSGNQQLADAIKGSTEAAKEMETKSPWVNTEMFRDQIKGA